MPTLSMFYGIIIYMYFYDDAKHKTPHIHVEYAGEEAVVSLLNHKILSGSIKPNKFKLVEAWMEIHKESLLANWSLAVKGEPTFKIEPLR